MNKKNVQKLIDAITRISEKDLPFSLFCSNQFHDILIEGASDDKILNYKAGQSSSFIRYVAISPEWLNESIYHDVNSLTGYPVILSEDLAAKPIESKIGVDAIMDFIDVDYHQCSALCGLNVLKAKSLYEVNSLISVKPGDVVVVLERLLKTGSIWEKKGNEIMTPKNFTDGHIYNVYKWIEHIEGMSLEDVLSLIREEVRCINKISLIVGIYVFMEKGKFINIATEKYEEYINSFSSENNIEIDKQVCLDYIVQAARVCMLDSYLYNFLNKKGISLEALSESIDMKLQFIKRMHEGHAKIPSYYLACLSDLANTYGCSSFVLNGLNVFIGGKPYTSNSKVVK